MPEKKKPTAPEDNNNTLYQLRLECLKIAYDISKTIGDFDPFNWERKSSEEQHADLLSLYEIAEMHFSYITQQSEK